MEAKLMGLLKDEAGQGMTEYGLIIALIAVAAILTLTSLGTSITNMFTKAAGAIQ